MSTAVVAVADTGANAFQMYLIPPESKRVRYCMIQAAVYASRSNFFYAHFVSVAFAITAVAMSLINAFSYLLQIPVKLILKIIQLNFIGALQVPFRDTKNVILSLLFVSLGMTFIAAGLLFPKVIFTHFAPEYYEPTKERLTAKLLAAESKNQRLEEEVKKLTEALNKAGELIQTQQEELFNVKHPVLSWPLRKMTSLKRKVFG